MTVRRHQDDRPAPVERASASGPAVSGQEADPHQGHRDRSVPQRRVAALSHALRLQLQRPLGAAPAPAADGQVHGRLGPPAELTRPSGVEQSLELHGESTLPEQGPGAGRDAVLAARTGHRVVARGEPHRLQAGASGQESAVADAVGQGKVWRDRLREARLVSGHGQVESRPAR